MIDDTNTPTIDTGLDFDINVDADVSNATPALEPTQDVPDINKEPEPQIEQEPEQKPQQPQEEPEVQDFRALVGRRLININNKTKGELGIILKKYPEVRNMIEAPLRREAAYRDIFPTVAEAKQIRERFPNGLQDVQALESDVHEIEETDNLTYNKDEDGNYSGHPQLINNIFNSDRQAAVALFKTLPKEWARLDRDSYNEVMGKIVGATLTGTGSWEQLIDLREHAANTKELNSIVPALDKILNRLTPFVEDRPPDANATALERERQSIARDREKTNQTIQQQFHQSFERDGLKQQREIVGQHRIMQKLATVKSITPQKRAEIIDKVCLKMQQYLKKSPSFMRGITNAYNSRNLDEALKVQRANWNEWLVTRMIRDVMKVETPQLVSNNKSTVQRRAGTTTVKTDTTDNGSKSPTSPYQVNGQWYHKDGRRMTTSEAMRHAMTMA
jgi:hypothetical protein